jgi:hypothetical protein
MRTYLILILVITFIIDVGCTTSDDKKICGIWQNGMDWFDIAANKTYSTGTGPMTSFTNLKYVMDANKKQITFYTNTDNKSFYMQYSFVGNDSLRLQNCMPNSLPVVFYRTKGKPSNF